MKRLVVLSGAGMSAESGLKTFRDANGLWEGHNVMAVASPEGWHTDRQLVLKFYNDRRRQLLSVEPNSAHKALAVAEKAFEVHIVTQNVDDLHERAGSTSVLHLHGQLRKARSTMDPSLVYDWDGDINIGDTCAKGAQLRPHIVWFGEAVPAIETAMEIVMSGHYVMIVGTSMQVYPAAGLIQYVPRDVPVYYVDPRPNYSSDEMHDRMLHIIAENATVGVPAALLDIQQNLAG